MTTSPFFKPLVYLSEEDAAYLAALLQQAEHCLSHGWRKLAWGYNAEAGALINRATLRILTSGDIKPDSLLMFGESASSYEEAQVNRYKKTVSLKLSLLEDSPLAREITEVLKRHMKGQETHE